MKTKELRIGNYLQGLSVVIVNSLSDNKINGYYSSGFSPIPLTGDILLRCGFSQAFGSDPQEPNAMLLYYKPTGDFTLMAMENDRSSFHYETGITITSVHQLQNLYFALTCKELEVSL